MGKLALLDEPIWVSNRRWRASGLLSTLWSWFWVQGLYLVGVQPEGLVGLYHTVRTVNPTFYLPSDSWAEPTDATHTTLTPTRLWEYEHALRPSYRDSPERSKAGPADPGSP